MKEAKKKRTSEKRTITLLGKSIEYTLRRSDAINPMRIRITVKPGGEVFVSAHNRRPLKDIEEFLRREARFVIDAEARMKEKQPLPSVREYTDGMTLRLLGSEVTLHIVQGSRAFVTRTNGEVLCAVPDVTDAAAVEKAVEKWLAEQCRQTVMSILEEEYPRFTAMGAPRPTQVRFRVMTSRWGSNSGRTNALTFNTRLVEHTEEVIRYVVLHELCHYIHHNHSAEFYKLLESLDPERKKHERMLRQ